MSLYSNQTLNTMKQTKIYKLSKHLHEPMILVCFMPTFVHSYTNLENFEARVSN